jgi:hypothetical protein
LVIINGGGDLKIGIYNSDGSLVGYAVIKQGLTLDFVMINSKDIPFIIK